MVIVNLSQVHITGAEFNFSRKKGLSSYGSNRNAQAHNLFIEIQAMIGFNASEVVLVPHADSCLMLLFFSHWLGMYGRAGKVALNVVANSSTLLSSQLGELTSVAKLYPMI